MLENLYEDRPGPRCKIDRQRRKLDDSDQKILDSALADTETWSDYHLAKALKARGLEMNETSLKRHRQGLCACSRT